MMNKRQALQQLEKMGVKLRPDELEALWAEDSARLRAARDRGLERLFPDPPPEHPEWARRREAKEKPKSKRRKPATPLEIVWRNWPKLTDAEREEVRSW